MKIQEALDLMKEYADNPLEIGLTKVSGKMGNKNGKNADSIAAGKAKAYKDDTYITHYEKMLPNLAKLTQDLKKNADGISLQVVGPAMEELNVLVKATKPLKRDKDGWILPMGDNIRLTKNGNAFFIRYVGEIESPINTPDVTPDAENEEESMVSEGFTNSARSLLTRAVKKLDSSRAKKMEDVKKQRELNKEEQVSYILVDLNEVETSFTKKIRQEPLKVDPEEVRQAILDILTPIKNRFDSHSRKIIIDRGKEIYNSLMGLLKKLQSVERNKEITDFK